MIIVVIEYAGLTLGFSPLDNFNLRCFIQKLFLWTGCDCTKYKHSFFNDKPVFLF
jgi:hypothetical protein